MPLPALAFAIPAATQLGLGLYQTIRGASMKANRPEYQIPAAAKEELALSRMGLNSRMPGFNYAQARIDQNAASSAYRLSRAATNPNQILAGLSNVQLQSNMAGRDLAQAEAADYARRESNLRRSLGVMANYQDKAWQLNKYEPFQDKARTKAALIQAGLTNFQQGISSGISNIYAADLMGGQALPNEYSPQMLGYGARGIGLPWWRMGAGAGIGALQTRAAGAMTNAAIGF